jgi:hypothetical protein
VSTANKNSNQRNSSNSAQERLQAPWFVHVNVWIFMIVFGVSPVLCVLGAQGSMQPGEAFGALAVVLLIQSLLWMAQRLCSSQDLSYWEGLLAAAAAMTSGIAPITLVLSFCILLFTVVASCAFALTHDGRDPLRHASIRFRRLIIAIHQRRLYR